MPVFIGSLITLQHRDSAVLFFMSRRVRNSIPILFVVALVVNVGMWLERFVIVVVSLHRDYILRLGARTCLRAGTGPPKVGTIGLFLTLFYLFIPLPADEFPSSRCALWSKKQRGRAS